MGADPISDLETELAEFWRRGRAQIRERCHEIDPRLDPSCYPLLIVLARHPQMRMSDLATELGLEKSTVTRQTDAVVRLGLVERTIDPDDARARVVSVTDDGRKRLEAVAAVAIANWRSRLARWEPDDIRTLATLLRRLAASADGTDPVTRTTP